MELQFKFKDDDTFISAVMAIPDDRELNHENVQDMRNFLATVVRGLGKATEAIDQMTEAYLKSEDYDDEEEPRRYDNYCEVCDRIFKGPAALKQHRTVMGHNGQNN